MINLQTILLDIGNSLSYLFSYQAEKPLNFAHPHFWIFFVFVLSVLLFIRSKIALRNIFLTIFSFFFYYKSGGIYFFLLIISTIADYHFGEQIYSSGSRARKKRFVFYSLLVNLGLLAYFKYSFYIVDEINYIFGTTFEKQDYFSAFMNGTFGTNLSIDKLIVPVGISFYSFQTISYSIDIYRDRIKPVNNIVDFAFYVSFFPQLVAGPIVRANEFVPQIYDSKLPSKKEYGVALALIVGGAIKKIFIADYIGAMLVQNVFTAPEKYSGFMNLMGGYGYSLQIYGDFSGYSDMAIGISALMGFNLPANFNSPYKASNITDFWRRWHISLSAWLKDYLYISLGGNRKGKVRTYINLMLTMLLGGLWHGAQTTFIIWGGLHGGALAFHKFTDKLIKLIFLSVSLLLTFYGIGFLATPEWQETINYTLVFFSGLLIIYLAAIGLCYVPFLFSLIGTFFVTVGVMLIPGSWIIGTLIFFFGLSLVSKDIVRILDKTLDWKDNGFKHFANQFITFHFVLYCWLFFAANGDYTAVQTIIKSVFTNFNTSTVWAVCLQYKYVFAMIIFGFTIHFLDSRIKDKMREGFANLPDPIKAIIIAGLVLAFYQVQTGGVMPFIYFSF